MEWHGYFYGIYYYDFVTPDSSAILIIAFPLMAEAFMLLSRQSRTFHFTMDTVRLLSLTLPFPGYPRHTLVSEERHRGLGVGSSEGYSLRRQVQYRLPPQETSSVFPLSRHPSSPDHRALWWPVTRPLWSGYQVSWEILSGFLFTFCLTYIYII